MKKIPAPNYPSVAELKARIKQREAEAMSAVAGRKPMKDIDRVRIHAEAEEWPKKGSLKDFIK